jgi:hypothetical protein
MRIPQHGRIRLRSSWLSHFLLFIVCGCSRNSETVFAPDYTEQQFGMVQIGDESNRVVELIGMPLRADHQRFSELWIYGVPPTAQPSDGFLVKQSTIPIPRLVLSFGANGLVQSYYGQEGASFQSKDKKTVQAMLGLPIETKTNQAISIFNYSKGKHSGSFDVRAVIFNEKGRVLEKKSFFYRD